MKKVVTGEQMRRLDRHAIEEQGMPSMVLMERAALAVVQELCGGAFDTSDILVVCGGGNNGGDGVAVARIMHLRGYRVDVWLVGDPGRFSEGIKEQIVIAEKYHINFVTNPDPGEYTVIVDAIFGVGISRNVGGKYRDAIEAVNGSKVPVAAVDIPSGIHSDTGEEMGCAIRAQSTVTFAFDKPGLFLRDGQTHSGRVITADIGIYEDHRLCAEPCMYRPEHGDLAVLTKRDQRGNKGTFGKILLIAGSRSMAGAALLAGKAALRSGAGMVKIYTAAENRDLLLGQFPEAMLTVYDGEAFEAEQLQRDLEWADVTGIGPGLSTDARAARILEYVMRNNTNPCVIDADALNLLSLHMHLLETAAFPCILTPHIGEFARLSDRPVSGIKADVAGMARLFAEQYKVVCVCKDARTVTAFPDGTCFLNTSGCSALATAGSGDVLTGMLLGYLAQSENHRDIKCVPLAVYLHGLLGQRASRRLTEASVLATDLIDELSYLSN